MAEVHPEPIFYIYSLRDPRTGEACYIGVGKNPKRRLSVHLAEATQPRNQNPRKEAWIRSLLALGLRPQLLVLQACSKQDWPKAERFWIAHARAMGCRLTNITEGGDGVRDVIANPEHIAIWHDGRKRYYEGGITEEHRTKLREINRGRTQSPELIERRVAKVRGRHRQTPEGTERSAQARRSDYIVTTPLGEECRIRGLYKFARQTGLSPQGLQQVLKGNWEHCKGWKIRWADKNQGLDAERGRKVREAHLKKWVLISPDGEEHFVTNLPQFCSERGLEARRFYEVNSGRLPAYKGWRIRRADEEPR